MKRRWLLKAASSLWYDAPGPLSAAESAERRMDLTMAGLKA
jgi:hypothetical protein